MTILHNNFSLEGAAEAGCLAIGPRGNNVRFGSKADMCSAQADVRYVPIADIGNHGALLPSTEKSRPTTPL
jgi:hypothetical protein